MRTERICRIEADGTQTPMVLVPAATVDPAAPIKWHKDGQGGLPSQEDLPLESFGAGEGQHQEHGEMRVRGLVLSVFPGFDLLGRAFEANGWCVVRGPDVLWGQDIRGWHPPPGRFDGVIGGPPCQCFSRLANISRAQGIAPRHGNMIPEFERVVREAKPRWWLMENVQDAPSPVIQWSKQESFLLSPRDLGDPQNRTRRFTFGADTRPRLFKRLPLVAMESIDRVGTVTANGPERTRVYIAKDGRKKRMPCPRRSWDAVREAAEIQGFPELADELRDGGSLTQAGAARGIGNGVPMVMGEALAAAINEWLDEEDEK